MYIRIKKKLSTLGAHYYFYIRVLLRIFYSFPPERILQYYFPTEVESTTCILIHTRDFA